MNGEAEKPDWNLLPHRPQQFFELEDGYDRKDLKRAFNRWLKIYRPEKYPKEFQKIREAYEFLESQIRGDDSTSPSFNFPLSYLPTSIEILGPGKHFSSDLSHPEDIVSGEGPNPVDPVSTDWSTLLDRLSPSELYNQLEAKHDRRVDDYIALAILSDAVFPPEEAKFVHWLLDGMQTYPNDRRLLNLLSESIENQQVFGPAVEGVLVRLSKVHNRDDFYSVARPLLDQHLSDVPWEQFKKVLQACQSNVSDHHVYERVEYTSHLLRRALWKAPIDDCIEMAAFMESQDHLHRALDFDIELNQRLIQYKRVREDFRARGPVSEKIDDCIRIFCTSPKDESLAAIITCQNYIAAHSKQLFKELPLSMDKSLTGIEAWIWITHTVHQNMLYPIELTNDQFAVDLTRRLMLYINQITPSLRVLYFEASHLFMQVLLGALTALPLLVVEYFLNTKSDSVLLRTVSIVAGIVIYARFLKPRFYDPWSAKRLVKILGIHYRNWWRDALAGFHASTRLAPADVLMGIHRNLELSSKDFRVSSYLPIFYQDDVAMAIYASATRMQH